ncbi:hypothetical protein BDD12DRAFT_916743 [Trichophaea hybrida]|nr:hypothetical protein BDD12DRAFT_916743 [Trichophaea hybrida]
MTTGSFSSPSSSAAPSHVFIVRHGARLDAADKDWSQSSPTPYDTPLTYSGWVQCRNLGVRIASLLHTYQPPKSAPKKKQTRIVVHSSPFLRCIQTSISIVSGIAQHHHQQAVDTHCENKAAEPERFRKPVLRLDAWLGEWMTMDYYTDITPPPISQLMVGTARHEYMRAPGGTVPRSFVKSSSSLQQDEAELSTSVTGGFIPPLPSYAISNSGIIPSGYFSQAKEFADFDIAWESTKLGEGAELGEEWSTMHTRFRSGFKQLIQYYSNEKPSIATATTRFPLKKEKSPTPTTVFTCGYPTPPLSDSDPEGPEDSDIETVVILVTHGAGGNALLGAITDKPVLIDIGIGSLSWGVLRPTATPAYGLKLTANTEHMRPSTPSTSTPPHSPYLNARPRNISGIGSFVLSSSGVSGSSLAVAMGGCKTHRSASTGHGARPTGLWTMPRPEDRERARTWVREESLENEVALLVVGEKEKEEVMVPVERSGSVVDGGTTEGAGLWAARAWKSPPKRRWTVGREGGWDGNGSGSG